MMYVVPNTHNKCINIICDKHELKVIKILIKTGRGEWKGDEKRIKMCYVFVPTL